MIEIGATSGLPTSSWIWACAVSGMSRGLPWCRARAGPPGRPRRARRARNALALIAVMLLLVLGPALAVMAAGPLAAHGIILG